MTLRRITAVPQFKVSPSEAVSFTGIELGGNNITTGNEISGVFAIGSDSSDAEQSIITVTFTTTGTFDTGSYEADLDWNIDGDFNDAGETVLFTGKVHIEKGKIASSNGTVFLQGKSLLHSAPLTTVAFTRGFFGESGKYIIAIGLLLFAFSISPICKN